jgi:hypothetical protein
MKEEGWELVTNPNLISDIYYRLWQLSHGKDAGTKLLSYQIKNDTNGKKNNIIDSD